MYTITNGIITYPYIPNIIIEESTSKRCCRYRGYMCCKWIMFYFIVLFMIIVLSRCK